MMWRYIDYPYLYHHGILGMKWGKRNGPPYPLSNEKHSVSENKAGWYNSLKSTNKTTVLSILAGIGALVLTNSSVVHAADQGKKYLSDNFEDVVSGLSTYYVDDPREYAIAMSALKFKYSNDKEHRAVSATSDKYVYFAENLFDGDFRIVWREPIPDAVTGLLPRINDEDD